MKNLAILTLFVLALPAEAAWPEQFTIYAVGARSTPNKHGQDSFESLNFEATGPTKWPFEWGVAFAPTLISQPVDFFDTLHEKETVHAASLSLLARHTFAQRGSVRPYVELSSGPIYANRRVPETTSHYNFISQGGVGVLTNGGWMAGIRFFHISNAGYADSNPGVNFVGILFGRRLH